MTRWNLSIPDETDRTVRTYLARTGMKKGSLSAFVDEAVRSRVFELTVQRIKVRPMSTSGTRRTTGTLSRNSHLVTRQLSPTGSLVIAWRSRET